MQCAAFIANLSPGESFEGGEGGVCAEPGDQGGQLPDQCECE